MDVSGMLNHARGLQNNLRLAAHGWAQSSAIRILARVRAVTPPCQEGVSESEALERGRAMVEGDVHKVIREVADDHTKPKDVAAIIKPLRSKGRVGVRLNPRIAVRRSDARRYIAAELDNVGLLMRSWRFETYEVGSISRLRLVNDCPYAGNIPGLQDRVNAVLREEIRTIEDQGVPSFLRRHGQTVGSTITIS